MNTKRLYVFKNGNITFQIVGDDSTFVEKVSETGSSTMMMLEVTNAWMVNPEYDIFLSTRHKITPFNACYLEYLNQPMFVKIGKAVFPASSFIMACEIEFKE